jgi:hypothetical protein
MNARADAQAGSALVVTLALFAIALGLTTLATARAITGAQSVVRRERQIRALNAAEAGLACVAQRLRFDPWMSSDAGEIGPSAWSAEISHDLSSFDSHVAVVVIEARAVDQSRRIRSRILVVPSLALEMPAELHLLSWELVAGD